MNKALHNLPWLDQQQAKQIVKAFNNNHAILLNGHQGIGKSQLASGICQSLISKPHTQVSREKSCVGTHPDIHVLTSAFAYQNLDPQFKNNSLRYLDSEALDKKRLSRQISVNIVRRLLASLSEAATTGGYKLVVIYPVEHMNNNASNAILKFLEEPTAKTFFILISHDISRLSATLRSRCMRININLPDAGIASSWLASIHPEKTQGQINNALELAAYGPLIAAEFLSTDQQSLIDKLQTDITNITVNGSTNIIKIAKAWCQYRQTDFILSWLCQYLSRLIKFKLLPVKEHNDLDANGQFEVICESFSTKGLFETYDYLISLKHSYDGVVDELLLIEDVLQTMMKNFKSTG